MECNNAFRHHHYVLFTLFLLLNLFKAQTASIQSNEEILDSLLLELKDTRKDTNRVNTLSSAADLPLHTDVDSANVLTNEALAFCP